VDERLLDAAAANNAAWCDAVCRLRGIDGAHADDAWTSPMRTPDYYPDAVTLRRSVDVSRLLGRIDSSAGCSIKDSFADLALQPHGFSVLFEAQWLHWPAEGQSGGESLRWTQVRDADGLADWDEARGRALVERWDYPAGIVSAADVIVAAGSRAEEVVAGAALCTAAGVVGLANVYATDGRLVEAFRGAAAAAARWRPGAPVVGYETGSDLEAALEAGFEPIGPLSVWLKG